MDIVISQVMLSLLVGFLSAGRPACFMEKRIRLMVSFAYCDLHIRSGSKWSY
jgi:hypothetical protein